MNVLTIVLLVFVVATFVLAFGVWIKLQNRKKLGQEELNYIHSHWVRIIDMASANPKQAVMDADKILDYVLDRRGYKGTLGEKLKKAGPRFSDQNGIWMAHKLRNTIAHEMIEISQEDTKMALKNFKRAMNDLGAGL